MKIAVLQMTGGVDPAANAAVLADAIARAKTGGAAMLFTPEVSGLVDRDRERAAANIRPESDDCVLAAVREAAAAHGLWVHLGSLLVRRDDGKLANRGFVIDDSGDIRARYDKLHLFDVDLPSGESWRESASYTAGKITAILTAAFASRSDDSTFLEYEDANGGNSLLLPNRNLDPGYAKIDLGGSYNLLSWLGVYAQAENLTDNQHIAPIGYVSLPVNVRGGVRLQWGKAKVR